MVRELLLLQISFVMEDAEADVTGDRADRRRRLYLGLGDMAWEDC